jgi:hypothetical protein
MKTVIAAVLALSIAAPTAVSAKSPSRHHHPRAQTSAQASPRHLSRSQVETNLTAALNAMVGESAIPPGQTRRFDRDQGDDHASARAIFLVCNSHTPAARRSAICPVPASPD